MHLASGRAFTSATISCLLVLFLISLSPVARTQEKTEKKPGDTSPSKQANEPASSPTPPTESATPNPRNPLSDIGPGLGQGPVITNTDLITFTVTSLTPMAAMFPA